MTTEASCDLVRGCLWTVGAVVTLKVALLAGGWSRQASQEAALRREMALAAHPCCSDDLATAAEIAARRVVEPVAYRPEVIPPVSGSREAPFEAPCGVRPDHP